MKMSRKKFFSGNNTFLANLLKKKIKSLQFHAQWKSDSLQNIAKRNCNLQIYDRLIIFLSVSQITAQVYFT